MNKRVYSISIFIFLNKHLFSLFDNNWKYYEIFWAEAQPADEFIICLKTLAPQYYITY